MNTHHRRIGHRTGALALVALCALTSLLCGCGRPASTASQASYPAGPGAPRQGMSTKQKVAILAGAAALYYLYNKHKNSQGAGKSGQYYLSKNGRVYYRDQNGSPVWVTPPPGGIQVPESEAQQYSRYSGYNGNAAGESFGGYGAGHLSQAGGPPGPPGR